MIEWFGVMFKFIAPAIVLGVSLCSLLVDSPWRDRPTRERRRALRVRIAMMVVATLVGEVGILSSHASEQRERRETQTRVRRAQEERRGISTSIADLVILARQRDPELSEQQALTEISTEIRALREETAELESEVTGLKRFSDVAKLNARGVRGIAGLGLTESSPISRALEGAYAEKEELLYPRCDVTRMTQFGIVAQEHPTFPFAHYALAVCHQALGNANWREHAHRALEILKYTTQLAGHHPQQEQILGELQRLLRGEE